MVSHSFQMVQVFVHPTVVFRFEELRSGFNTFGLLVPLQVGCFLLVLTMNMGT